MAIAETPNLELPYPDPGTGEPNNVPAHMKALAERLEAVLPVTYARLTYIDAETYKTGANTDLQAIQAACAAATALSSGYAVVRLSSRTWDVGNGLAMSGYRCGIEGTGSAQNGGTYKGTILHASTQTGPVLDITGLASPAFGRMPIGGFTLKGDNTADATKVKCGLAQTSGTALSGLWIHDITVVECGGHGVDMRLLYLSTMERIVVRTPVSAKANDVAYIKLTNCSGTTFNDLGCRSTLSSADTGASGALIVTDDGLNAGDHVEINHPWFEFLHVPTNGSLISVAGNNTKIRNVYLPDSGKEAAATGTSVVRFLAPAVQNSGGNELTGTIPGTNSGSWDTGVKVSQSNNRIVGVKGFIGGNVTLDAGVGYTYVALGGRISGATGAAFTDNSGVTTNTLLDYANYPGTGVAPSASTPVTTTAIKGSNTVRNNTAAAAADPDLVLPVVSGGVYLIEAFIPYTSSTTADLLFGITVPGASSLTWAGRGLVSGTSGTSASIDMTARTSGNAAVGGAGSIAVLAPVGRLTAGGNGSITVQWAQNVAEVSDTTVHAGAWLRLTRIA